MNLQQRFRGGTSFERFLETVQANSELWHALARRSAAADWFVQAVVVLLAFILFGHWMEIRARAGASNAIRATACKSRWPHRRWSTETSS